MRPARPTSLLIVASIFIALGLGAIATSAIGISRGTGGVSLNALNLLIGIGLLRRDPYWRRWAVVACWLGIIVTGVLLALIVFGTPSKLSATLYGLPLNRMSPTYAFLFALASLAVPVWQLWILQRPSVRALFIRTDIG